MKNPTEIKDFDLVLAGAYTRDNLEQSLRDPVIVRVHALIKTVLYDIPKKGKK